MSALLLGVLVAAAQDDPYALLKKSREKLAAANTVRLKAETTWGDQGVQTIDLAVKGDRWTLTWRSSGLMGESSGGATCDGKRVVLDGPTSGGPWVDDPALLPHRIRSGVGGFALLLGSRDALKDGEEFLKPKGREKLGSRESIVVGWAVVGERAARGTIWLDAETLLPAKQSSELGEDEPKVTETYEWTLDAEIPDSTFALQSKARLTRALMRQLERSIGVYQLYVGLAPKTLEDLVKPSGAEPFWPAGGYLPRTVPKDAWGNPFLYDGGSLLSLGEDGKAGGTGDAADLVVDLAPAGGSAVRPATERLKAHYAARVKAHLLAAAAVAYRQGAEVAGGAADEAVMEGVATAIPIATRSALRIDR